MGETRDSRRDVVVIGGSAGALEALRKIVEDLPPELPAAVLVTLHLSATARSALPTILSRIGGMHAVAPRDRDPIRHGYIYVATPDRHMELQDGKIRITRGPRINGVRPAIDVLFRSAAAAHGGRVVGVVLSGGLDDGSAGLATIRAAGGFAIVQEPEDAVVGSMPRSAIKFADPDRIAPASGIGRAIVQAVHGEGGRKSNGMGGDAGMEAVGAKDTAGQVTGITCPECHGSIWLQTGEGGEVMLTCRIGHSYAPESFYEVQAKNVEDALWAGVRSLEEQVALAEVLAARAARSEDDEGRQRYESRARLAAVNADTLRKLLLDQTEA